MQMINKIKYIIFISIVVLFSNTTSFAFVNNNQIDNTFYYNINYANDKKELLSQLENQWNLLNTLKKCLKVTWPKYFNKSSNVKQYCIYQIKNFLKDINNPLSKKFPYNITIENNYFLSHWKNIINNYILQYINVKEKWTKFTYTNIPLVLFKWIQINKIILNDLKLMEIDYKKQFNNWLFLNSWYRSIKDQTLLYNEYIKKYWVNQSRATKPWFSEHHTWTAIDVKILIKKDKNWNIVSTNYNWLKQNSWKYWFIQSYDNNCMDDWIMNENWHYRWIWKELSIRWKSWKYSNKNKCNIFFLKELNKK